MLRHFSWSVQMSPDDHAYPPIARARNGDAGTTTVPSVCPHDCTSTCALDVERLSRSKIGRVRGSMRNDLHCRRDLREGRALRRTRSTIPTG
jgi:hypothetical protein